MWYNIKIYVHKSNNLNKYFRLPAMQNKLNRYS